MNNEYELYEITIDYADNKEEKFYKMYTMTELLEARDGFTSRLCCNEIVSYKTKLISIDIWRNMVTEKIFSSVSIEDFCKMILRLSKEV